TRRMTPSFPVDGEVLHPRGGTGGLRQGETCLRGWRPGHLRLGGCAFDGRPRDCRPELRHLVARVDRRPRADLAAIDIGTLTLDRAGLLRRRGLLGAGGGCRGQEDETTGVLQLSWHGVSVEGGAGRGGG